MKKAEQFNIARKPRPQTLTRPLVPTASITGVKRKPTSDLNYAGRPPQPAVPSSARGTKRQAPLMPRPPQPAGPPIDDLQMPPKARKKVDTPPRRPNQKRGARSEGGGAYRERLNNKSSRTAAR